jgi:hypothetical protein
VSSWSVSIVLASREVIGIVELQLFLKWKSIKFASKSKLAVHLFLGDAEILHVEKAYIETIC